MGYQKMTNKLLKKIEEKEYTVGIVGLGYVGLPLMWTFHQKGFPVIGFDIDEKKIDCIDKGVPYIKHLDQDMMGALSDSDHCDATTDFEKVKEADCLLLCVPTPLDNNREPDMSYVESTARTIAPYIREGHLVALESTTWPGTTEELIIPILEEGSGLSVENGDFYLAYSPEREDPGNKDFNTAKIPKVVGATGENAMKIASALYGSAIVEVVPVSDTRTAEAVKLTENIFRSVNIALVNELKTVFQEMDIDVHEVLDAADTKPFGFMKFTPGPGLGGHCIPIDPFYLTWKAREFGKNTRFIELSGEVNTSMPQYVIDRTLVALNAHQKPLNGSKVLVLGLAYKPDVDDMRESPSFHLMDLLGKYNAEISYYDDYLPEIPPSREHDEWTGTKSVKWDKDTISSFDAVIISTNHSDIDYQQLAEWNDCIIDTRNAMKEIEPRNDNHIWKA